MIDPLAVAVRLLSTDADLNTLTAGRVATKHKFGLDTRDAWPTPAKALQVSYAGGSPELSLTWQQVGLEARCYGESQVDAAAVFNRLVQITRQTERVLVPTAAGVALVYWLAMGSGPSVDVDEALSIDVVTCTLDLAVSEEAVA